MSTNIYFIRNTATNNFKIGKAICPENRLKQLQTGNEAKLEIYKIIEATHFKLETSLHSYFKDKRISGEWFNVTTDDIDEVIDLITIEANYADLSIYELSFLAKINGINGDLKREDVVNELITISSKKLHCDKSISVGEFREYCVII